VTNQVKYPRFACLKNDAHLPHPGFFVNVAIAIPGDSLRAFSVPIESEQGAMFLFSTRFLG
jgi:hypothetical protein